ncbi:lactonase family protein [Streptomyces sp. CHA1]|uniref:lactonase family protein n=1 Tax=Streptomyces TaxID=1883 RepID=UPI0003C2BE45|nr:MULTISPECIES: lactonase family protein [unclassified Streptomyces]QOZ98200.1 lactonase family protein [Streptomyces violascens]UYM25792.1 lactonase family protein [Streptomyces albus]WSB23783.1 lactonase family protein [Streptomyces albidoflavus]ESQ01343.1 Secreted protein [Streptomyces sp. GBA 94-10 4N24]ESQ07153.1 Secreted protein [Streptomyces sp. PVA_94-07]
MGGGERTARAYIGSFTAAGGAGVVTAAVGSDGGLTVLGATAEVPDPSYLALGPGGDLLYAVSETADGAVAAFDPAGDTARLLAPRAPVAAEGPTHLCVHGGRVFTANYGSGSVSVLPLRADGTPAPAAHVLNHHGSGPHPQRQQGPHVHQVLPDPSGRWLVAVDLGTDSVRVHALRDGMLTLHREIALRPGSGPRHLAFHPDGHHLYVLNELAPTLTVCRWDADGGDLRPLGETAVLPGTPGADAYPSEVVVSPDGRFLWTATRGEDVLSVLALDPAGDAARLLTTVPCGGHWPRDLVLSPQGLLYAANERSGDVAWFTVDTDSGTPALAGSVPAPAASCVLFG